MDASQRRVETPSAPAAGGPSLVVNYQKIVNAFVWIFVVCGAIALVEPSPYDYASFLAIPLWFFGGFTMQRSFIVFAFLILLYTLMGFWTLIPYWSDADSALYEYQSAYLTMTGLFFALFVGDRTPERAELILKAYVAASLIAASCGIIGYFNIGGLGELFSRYGRASGTFKDPNVLGSFVILGALYLTQNLILARARSVIFTVGLLTILVAGIFLSFSRGSWGAAIFAAVVMIASAYFTTKGAKTKRRIAIFAIVAVIAAVVVVLILLSMEETREVFFKRAALTQDYDEGATGRFGNQLRSIPLLLERFDGFGPLRFRLIFGLEPHNSYLGAFANAGWLGGLLFILVVGVTSFVGFRLMFRASPYQRQAQVYFPALLAFFLQAFQIDIDHWRHVFLMLGAVWGLEAARQKWDFRQALARNLPERFQAKAIAGGALSAAPAFADRRSN
jgi:O-antigen ligase